ncbi:MAG TPA: hypothetical protein VEK57_27190 [Thermoanaerobaculia bacterium]|nr:hypothetical protein [Thermoanaerobaculia bacterium]
MRKLPFLLALLTFTLTASASEQFSYIYKRGNDTHIRSNADIESMVALSKRWSGEYVWVQRGGRAYLIRDAAVLAEVRAAFADLHALEPALRAAQERLHPLEQKRDRLEERMDRISDRLGDDDRLDRATRAGLEKQLRQLELEFAAVERPYASAERESERLDRESERLEEIAEKRFEKVVIRAIERGRVERVD